ncbi:MAG: ABC transporter substrate-binding protein, partial [Nitrospirota bacterium]
MELIPFSFMKTQKILRPHRFLHHLFKKMSYPKILIFFFVIMSFFFVNSGCSKNISKDEKKIVVGIESNPTNLDPRFATDAYSEKIDQLIFNKLVRLDEKSNVVPDLAERWKIENDTVYTFYLKKGVRFHNGVEMKASDVRYTFESILDPSMVSPHQKAFEKIDKIEVIDDYTIKFILKESHAPFLTNMVRGIVPEEIAKKRGKEFAHSPIGTGPFKFVKWSQDEAIELERNNNYFDKPPKIEKIIFKIIPEDTVRILELQKGGIDFIQNAIPPDMLPILEKDPRLKIIKKQGINYSYIGFNLQDPILSDVRVRKAIAYAINKKSIIKEILRGLAMEANSLLPHSHWAHEHFITRYPYNKKKAKSLLDDAGYIDPDGDGPKSRFKLIYKTSQNQLANRIGEVLQYQL